METICVPIRTPGVSLGGGAAVYDLDVVHGRVDQLLGLERLLGYAEAELPLTDEEWSEQIHPEDRARYQAALQAALADGGQFSCVYRLRRADGSFALIEDNGWVITDPEGRAIRRVGSLFDATACRAAQQQLKALNETLEQRVLERSATAEKRTSQLRVLAAELTQAEERERRRLAQVLHDHLQQLLVAGRIKLSMLRRRTRDDRFAAVIGEVDGLLDQAITESRSLTVELSPPILYEAGLVAALEWLARQMGEKHSLRVEVHAGGDVEPAEEDCRVFLFQAIREMLLNVVKHAHASTARIDLHAENGDWLHVTVSDTGVGFDPTAANPRARGGGFGLFSIRERLELIGGRLEIDSAVGKGTRMVIVVPRRRHGCSPQPAPATTTEPQAERSAAAARKKVRKKVRVLVVDDHELVRQGLAGLLKDFRGVKVVGEASNGREAIELAIRSQPDVVLMDITMPGMNGVEATRRIVEALPQTRVIGLSIHEESDMAVAMQNAGAAAYLRKDIPAEVLFATISG